MSSKPSESTELTIMAWMKYLPAPPPPHFLNNKGINEVEWNLNITKGKRDWQNLFVIMRFLNFNQGSFSYYLKKKVCYTEDL